MPAAAGGSGLPLTHQNAVRAAPERGRGGGRRPRSFVARGAGKPRAGGGCAGLHRRGCRQLFESPAAWLRVGHHRREHPPTAALVSCCPVPCGPHPGSGGLPFCRPRRPIMGESVPRHRHLPWEHPRSLSFPLPQYLRPEGLSGEALAPAPGPVGFHSRPHFLQGKLCCCCRHHVLGKAWPQVFPVTDG